MTFTTMKKIVVFGGGSGLSCILSGLKLFPIDVTAIITVSDDGSSTGVLKEELDIPAVGDLGKVLLSMETWMRTLFGCSVTVSTSVYSGDRDPSSRRF